MSDDVTPEIPADGAITPDEARAAADSVGTESDDTLEEGGPADFEKMRTALRRANEQAKRFRLDAKEAESLRARVAEFEEKDKSEAEKAAARAEAAEKRAVEAEAKALRLEIADELKVPAHLRKFLTATDEDALREQATDLLVSLEAAMAESGPRQPKPDPSQGAKPNSGPDRDRQIAEALAAGDIAKSIALKRQKAYAPTT